jgi:hypothetical protein
MMPSVGNISPDEGLVYDSTAINNMLPPLYTYTLVICSPHHYIILLDSISVEFFDLEGDLPYVFF